jgi:hypothetical protein
VRFFSQVKVLNPGDLDLVLEPGDVVASIKAEKIPSGPEALSYTQVGWSWDQCCGSGSGIGCLFDPWIRDGRKSASGSGIRVPG